MKAKAPEILHLEDQRTRYQIGAPIELADLLALPPDGNRYTRDDEGRLALMAPDDAMFHGNPLCRLTTSLIRLVPEKYWVLHERAIAFEKIYDLKGERLRDSFLGPKSVEPDIAIFARRPRTVTGPHGLTINLPGHLRLVIEVLSTDTWRSDLGLGRADEVDRKRTYLESGVPEYWILNAGVRERACPIPPRSGLFLRRSRDGRSWVEMPQPGRVVRSRSITQLALDLARLWRECGV